MYEYNAQPDVKYHSSPTRSSERTFEQQQFPFKWKLKSRKLLLQSVSRTTSDFLRPSTSHADLSDSAAGRKSFYRLNISRFRETRQSSRLTETLASQPARYRLVAWEGQSERRIWRGDWPTSCCNSLETIILRVLTVAVSWFAAFCGPQSSNYSRGYGAGHALDFPRNGRKSGSKRNSTVGSLGIS